MFAHWLMNSQNQQAWPGPLITKKRPNRKPRSLEWIQNPQGSSRLLGIPNESGEIQTSPCSIAAIKNTKDLSPPSAPTPPGPGKAALGRGPYQGSLFVSPPPQILIFRAGIKMAGDGGGSRNTPFSRDDIKVYCRRWRTVVICHLMCPFEG